jgi:ATP/maltotriose-dependent transcriptional regulator MalT
MQADDMWDQQPLATGVGGSEFVDRHLEMIETALDHGDIETAQRQLRMVRRSLGAGATSATTAPMPGGVVLTGQEIASLRLLPDGSLSQKDIARAMGVTRNTLKTHLKSTYLKLGVHCRSEAITRAREIGLLPRPLALVPMPVRDRGEAAVCA